MPGSQLPARASFLSLGPQKRAPECPRCVGELDAGHSWRRDMHEVLTSRGCWRRVQAGRSLPPTAPPLQRHALPDLTFLSLFLASCTRGSRTINSLPYQASSRARLR